jgi:hypothetical protein
VSNAGTVEEPPPTAAELEHACVVVQPFGSKVLDGSTIDFDVVYSKLLAPAIGETVLPNGEVLRPARFDGPPPEPLPEWTKSARLLLVDITGADPEWLPRLGITPGAQAQPVAFICGGPVPASVDVSRVLVYLYDVKELESEQARLSGFLRGALRTTGGGTGQADPEIAQVVSLAAFGPAYARPGETITMGMLATLDRFEGTEVQRRGVKQSFGNVVWASSEVALLPATRLDVRFQPEWRRAPLLLQPSWNGDWTTIPLNLTLPEDLAGESTVVTVSITASGEPLATIQLPIRLLAAEENAAPEDDQKAAQTAFACYASIDRPVVLELISAILSYRKLDVFVDDLMMQSSETWQPRMEEEVRRRDIFLLFWSRAAANSALARREWQIALESHASSGKPEIQIHPLEDVPVEMIPEELRHLPFPVFEPGAPPPEAAEAQAAAEPRNVDEGAAQPAPEEAPPEAAPAADDEHSDEGGSAYLT